ncbi:hypothetical protein BESB_064760 [Besnoitia besnoiti]|uniref:Oocyst wall protein n=1 Tax=Besnoitia besnoiti TaxID=94643 RepID=A0A2A9M8Y9_BESBE|nr:hypothetical protein BESB_064760 [Besnoitia besnoiti]PFH34445.1 hypothetical protein BESB_064760 [Besnoitia besnoiti]
MKSTVLPQKAFSLKHTSCMSSLVSVSPADALTSSLSSRGRSTPLEPVSVRVPHGRRPRPSLRLSLFSLVLLLLCILLFFLSSRPLRLWKVHGGERSIRSFALEREAVHEKVSFQSVARLFSGRIHVPVAGEASGCPWHLSSFTTPQELGADACASLPWRGLPSLSRAFSFSTPFFLFASATSAAPAGESVGSSTAGGKKTKKPVERLAVPAPTVEVAKTIAFPDPIFGNVSFQCPPDYDLVFNQCQKKVLRQPMPSCPYGSYMNEDGRCISVDSIPAERTCPAGYQPYEKGCLRRDLLQAVPFCPTPGFQLFQRGPESDCVKLVEQPPLLTCREGLLEEGGLCVVRTAEEPVAVCPAGFSPSETTALCERLSVVDPIPFCEEGWDLAAEPESGLMSCVATRKPPPVSVCPDESFVLEKDACVRDTAAAPVPRCAPGFVYNRWDGMCRRVMAHQAIPVCREGWKFIRETGKCTLEEEPTYLCPDGDAEAAGEIRGVHSPPAKGAGARGARRWRLGGERDSEEEDEEEVSAGSSPAASFGSAGKWDAGLRSMQKTDALHERRSAVRARVLGDNEEAPEQETVISSDCATVEVRPPELGCEVGELVSLLDARVPSEDLGVESSASRVSPVQDKAFGSSPFLSGETGEGYSGGFPAFSQEADAPPFVFASLQEEGDSHRPQEQPPLHQKELSVEESSLAPSAAASPFAALISEGGGGASHAPSPGRVKMLQLRRSPLGASGSRVAPPHLDDRRDAQDDRDRDKGDRRDDRDKSDRPGARDAAESKRAEEATENGLGTDTQRSGKTLDDIPKRENTVTAADAGRRRGRHLAKSATRGAGSAEGERAPAGDAAGLGHFARLEPDSGRRLQEQATASRTKEAKGRTAPSHPTDARRGKQERARRQALTEQGLEAAVEVAARPPASPASSRRLASASIALVQNVFPLASPQTGRFKEGDSVKRLLAPSLLSREENAESGLVCRHRLVVAPRRMPAACPGRHARDFSGLGKSGGKAFGGKLEASKAFAEGAEAAGGDDCVEIHTKQPALRCPSGKLISEAFSTPRCDQLEVAPSSLLCPNDGSPPTAASPATAVVPPAGSAAAAGEAAHCVRTTLSPPTALCAEGFERQSATGQCVRAVHESPGWTCPTGYRLPESELPAQSAREIVPPHLGSKKGGDSPSPLGPVVGPPVRAGFCERLEYANVQFVCPVGFGREKDKKTKEWVCVADKAVPSTLLCDAGFFLEGDMCVMHLRMAPSLVDRDGRPFPCVTRPDGTNSCGHAADWQGALGDDRDEATRGARKPGKI